MCIPYVVFFLSAKDGLGERGMSGVVEIDYVAPMVPLTCTKAHLELRISPWGDRRGSYCMCSLSSLCFPTEID